MSLGCQLEKVQEADGEEERAWESQSIGAAVVVTIDGGWSPAVADASQSWRPGVKV